MPLTILIDLDDTLLFGSTTDILPGYLANFTELLSKHSDHPDRIIPALMKATESMARNQDPRKTLKDVFDADFYPRMGWDYETPQAQIAEFYNSKYSELEQLTSPNPAALDLIKTLLARGDQIVIATNPIFPMNAILQRLDWAGLSTVKQSFSLISSYEEFHFTKPNHAYFTEILGRIGWPENPVIMIGDNKNWDIDPAQELGIATFWIGGDTGYTHKGAKAPFNAGDLDALLPWLDALPTDQITPGFSSPIASTAILRSTPAVLSAFSGFITQNDWHKPLSEDGWDLTEIVCHLRDVDQEIYLPRLNQVKESERPFIEAINADPWAEARNYKEQDGSKALEDFSASRIELVALIESFEQDSWQKEIRHTIFGPLSLEELLKISARHDKLHLQHIYENLTPLN